MPIPTNQDPKHMHGFWPLAIIAVVAFIAGGIVIYAVFNSNLSDDLSSMVFNSHISQTCPKNTHCPGIVRQTSY